MIRKDMTSMNNANRGKHWNGITDEKLMEVIKSRAPQEVEEEYVSPWGANRGALSQDDRTRLFVMEMEERKKEVAAKVKALKRWNKSVLDQTMEELGFGGDE